MLDEPSTQFVSVLVAVASEPPPQEVSPIDITVKPIRMNKVITN